MNPWEDSKICSRKLPLPRRTGTKTCWCGSSAKALPALSRSLSRLPDDIAVETRLLRREGVERHAPAGEERRFFRLGAGKVCLLDMTEAADFERQSGDLDGDRVAGRRQIREDLGEHRFVLADQPTLGAPFPAAAENVKGRAT